MRTQMDAINLGGNESTTDPELSLHQPKPAKLAIRSASISKASVDESDVNKAHLAESFFMSHTWLGICAIQIALTLAVLAILSIDVEKYMHSALVLTLEAAVVLLAVFDLWVKLTLLGKSAWQRKWFIVDAIQVFLLVCSSAMLFLRETISWEEFEITLLWVRVVLQLGRFMLVLLRFKNAKNVRKVATDIRIDAQLGGALDRTGNWEDRVPESIQNQTGAKVFDVFV